MHTAWRALRTPYRSGRFTISAGASDHAETRLFGATLWPDPRFTDTKGHAPVGLGEAIPSARVTGWDADRIESALTAGARRLRADKVTVDPDGPPPEVPLDDRTGPAACAFDGALLDLWARARKEPLWRALGLPAPEGATTATVSLGPPEVMAEEAAGHATAGFDHLKVKLGAAGEAGGEGDIVRLRAVREAVPDAKIRIDANEAWSPATAHKALPALAEVDLELIEQPLPRDIGRDEEQALARLATDLGVPILRDEGVATAADVDRIGAEGRAHGVVLKLQKSGGLRPAQACLEAAERHGLRVMLGCFVETWAGITLALQLAGQAEWLDLDGAWLLAEEPVTTTEPLLAEGRFRTPEAPGLGTDTGLLMFT